MIKRFFFALLCMTSLSVYAEVPSWKIINKESSLSFTATQNNSPVTGKFTSFTGEIKADPNQLNASSVRIVVDLGSVTTSYAEVADTLKTSDWFNIKIFPQAIFEAKQFSKTGVNTYQANGSLRIRNKTLPVILNFTQEDYSAKKARVKGSAILKRTAFGIGQGEWVSTSEVKDEVTVNFVLSVTRK